MVRALRQPVMLGFLCLAVACGRSAGISDAGPGDAGPMDGGASGNAAALAHVRTVFLIVMVNHNWSDIYQSSSAPYINHTLLPQASYATQYFNPPGIHPSEPNSIWLESGSAQGITTDAPPSHGGNEVSTTAHIVTLLGNAGISWKEYAEDISGTICPLQGIGGYVPKTNPFVFFDDITGNLNPTDPDCISHNRPFTELATDLTNGTVARYNFITPNLCDDMHDTCAGGDAVAQGDTWLSSHVPTIMNSQAYQSDGAIFILWNESELGDFPIGMIALSPRAKGGGYHNSIAYDHSSTVKSLEEIFGVTPLLGHAADSTVNDLGDLFRN